MKRTKVSSLVVLAVVGGVLAALAQLALASSGRAIVVIPFTLPIALAAIGAIMISLAVPIRRMTRGASTEPIDPFYATRVVTLAKACALAGALLTGVGLGMVVYSLTRTAMPGVGSIASPLAAIVGAAALLACGLVAEHMCRVPPSDDEDDDDQKPIRATS